MHIRFFTAALTATALCAACGRSHNQPSDSLASDSAARAAAVPASDSSNGAISATTAAIGPGIQVTTTDAHNVNRSFDLKLVDDDWAKFLKAADTLAALRARDPQVRQHLDEQIVGAQTDDAGQKWLESDPKVASAITSSGLTVKDYYRLGIVTATAARFMNNPKSAPPTPAGRANAEFLRHHEADLKHLQALTQGIPSVR
ncbi:MAG TPA: hypothetical protein VGH98_21400 [Gemmatimonadaceae bacterium]